MKKQCKEILPMIKSEFSDCASIFTAAHVGLRQMTLKSEIRLLFFIDKENYFNCSDKGTTR